MTVQWWRSAVIYQIYPRSFADANADGNGDLEGITGRLGYLSTLGVDALWLNPFYVSPMADGGYDIADHTDVDPLFGDREAFDRLLSTAHAHGLRVIIDFVPTTPAAATGGLPSRPAPDRTRAATGTSGTTANGQPPVSPRRPTTGSARSAAQPGPTTPQPASGTCTPSCPTNPT